MCGYYQVMEPFSSSTVKQMILQILVDGTVSFTGHAYTEMSNDNLTENDVIAVMRGGVVSPGELRLGTWRYPIKTSRIGCAVAFRSEIVVVVVTAWRIR